MKKVEIFDNGYLTEEEKRDLGTQNLIYLAISFYTGSPVKEILPRYIYEYKTVQNGHIQRRKLECNYGYSDSTNVLWDIFVNTVSKVYTYWKYHYVSYLDDEGREIPLGKSDILLPEEKDVLIPMSLVGSNDTERYRNNMNNKVYFLEWKPDSDYLVFINKIHSSKKGDAA